MRPAGWLITRRWVHEGAADAHAGHPWLINGPVFARRLTSLTGVQVRAR
jgi:hypothetical protein